MELWKVKGTQFLANPSGPPPNEQKILKEIAPWYEEGELDNEQK